MLAVDRGNTDDAPNVFLRDVDATLNWLRLELRPDQRPLTEPYLLWGVIDGLGDSAVALLPELRRIAKQTRGPYDPREAALRLGQLGDAEAVDLLRQMLGDRSRWTFQLAAARALAALGRAAAPLESELRALARSHWSQGVRAMAAHAAERVAGRDSDEPDHRWRPRDDLCPPGIAAVYSTTGLYKGSMWRDRWPWVGVLGGVVMRFEERDPPVVQIPEGFPTLELGAKYRDLEPAARTRLPEDARVIHSIGGGWLVGTNHGEFGGSLWWIGRRGAVRHLARANVLELVTLGKHLYVISGIPHGRSDAGHLLRVRKTRRGVVIEHALELPSAPLRIWPRDDALYLGTDDGIVALDPDLDITLASCEGGGQEGTLDGADVRRTVKHYRPTADRCLEAIPSAPCREPVPTINLWFRLDEHGAVIDVEPMPDSLAPRIPEVEACIIEHARAWRFPAPKGRWASFGYIFEHAPRGS